MTLHHHSLLSSLSPRGEWEEGNGGVGLVKEGEGMKEVVLEILLSLVDFEQRWFLFHFISFYFISFYFILFYFILFYFILFYFILFYFILFYFILFYFILFYLFYPSAFLKKMIQPAVNFFNLNNYLATWAISSALSHPSVTRMEKTMKSLDEETSESLQAVSYLVSEEEDYLVYRFVQKNYLPEKRTMRCHKSFPHFFPVFLTPFSLPPEKPLREPDLPLSPSPPPSWKEKGHKKII